MKAKTISLGGLLLALSVIMLYGSVVLPTMRLSLSAFASFFVAVMIIEAGVSAGWTLYVASCILGLLLVPDKIGMMAYIMCFGLFGIVKYYAELVRSRPFAMMLKLVFLNSAFALMFFLFQAAFWGDTALPGYPAYLIIPFLEGIFILYDVVFSMMIQTYRRRRKVGG